RRHTRFSRDWSSDVCSSDLAIHEVLHEALRTIHNGSEFDPAAEVLLRHDPRAPKAFPSIVTPLGLGSYSQHQAAGLVDFPMYFEIGRASCRESVEIRVDGDA